MTATAEKVQLISASVEHTFLLENLVQFYIYDFSEYMELDVMRNGLFEGYNNLESYLREENKFAYLLKEENKFIGFVLVKIMDGETRPYFSITEFFILKRYRRKGAGRRVATRVFDQHRGAWKISQLMANKPARLFWQKVIAAYPVQHFRNYITGNKCIQEFQNY